MIRRVAAIRGRQPQILAVPVLSPRLSSYWLHLLTPADAAVARPLVEGLRNPTVVRDDAIRRLLPFALTRFDDAARAAVQATGRMIRSRSTNTARRRDSSANGREMPAKRPSPR